LLFPLRKAPGLSARTPMFSAEKNPGAGMHGMPQARREAEKTGLGAYADAA